MNAGMTWVCRLWVNPSTTWYDHRVNLWHRAQ
jgi:hypothetical protein